MTDRHRPLAPLPLPLRSAWLRNLVLSCSPLGPPYPARSGLPDPSTDPGPLGTLWGPVPGPASRTELLLVFLASTHPVWVWKDRLLLTLPDPALLRSPLLKHRQHRDRHEGCPLPLAVILVILR